MTSYANPSSASYGQQAPKPRLFEIAVTGECFDDASLLRHDETGKIAAVMVE